MAKKLKKGDTVSGKTPKYSDAGKVSKSRVSDIRKYAENWEKIFGKKSDKEGDSIQVEEDK